MRLQWPKGDARRPPILPPGEGTWSPPGVSPTPGRTRATTPTSLTAASSLRPAPRNWRRPSRPTRLLPLPELVLRVPVGVGAVLEDYGDRVQTTEVRGIAVVVQGPAIADRSSLEEFARSRALPGGLLAALAHDQALPLAVDAAVWPDSRAVGDVAPGFDPQELPGALHRDLHLGAALDRDHPAYHHFPGLLTDLFAQHDSLSFRFSSPDRLSRSTTQRTTLRGGVRLVDGG